MNGKFKTLLLMTLIAGCPLLHAADELGVYVGLNAGYAEFSDKIDINGVKIAARDGVGSSLYGGYKLNNSFAVELKYTDIETDTKEKVNYRDSVSCPSYCTIRGDLEVTTYGLYGVYRTAGNFYFKGRAGYLYEEVELIFAGNSYDTKYDGGFVGSLGGGIGFGSIKLEAEYNYLESGINFISLGAHYEF